MSVPKKKRTKGHVRGRRSHHALNSLVLLKCTKCGKAVEAHTACSFCGNYKGREILTIKTKVEKEVR